MLRVISSSVIVLLVTHGAVWAANPNGIRCALSVHQNDTLGSGEVLIWADTADFLMGKNVTGFAVGLSMEINVSKVDSASANITVHTYTFAPQPKHGARNFLVEYGLPGRIENLVGKNGIRYRLTLTPLEPITIDTAWCPYSHHRSDDFSVDPSAHMNIYYVPQTLGDFHWNAVKGMLEEEYDNFSRMVNFSMPGKFLLYLCPCKLSTVIWDDRYAMMIDPVRSTMHAVYAKDYNTVYPFLISQAAVYHNYGYAPAFLADGFANYLSFAIYDAKKLKKQGKLIPLDSLLDTYAYYQCDPLVSDRISATFVRYLIDQYQIGVFIDLYRKSDDLGLRGQIESTYGKSISTLESEWLRYLDTVRTTFDQAAYHAGLAETRLDYVTAHEYAGEMLRLAGGRRDSLAALNMLSRTAFFAGDYYAATKRESEWLGLVDTLATEWMKLAGYHLMNGDYDSASVSYDRAAALDSANSLIRFNQALHRLCVGDTLGARKLFGDVIQSGASSGGMVESQVMLGHLLLQTGAAADKSEALHHFNSVVSSLSRQDRRHNPSASQLMWLGIAYAGLGDTGNADDYLRTALFLETRPFYQGMIRLWLGKVAEARGERAVARDYYQQVIAGSSAYYHQEEARRLLERPARR
ncbi:MAG: hypothetical protein AB1772_10215 [Candidatus Zixiibacteriota bacterium]